MKIGLLTTWNEKCGIAEYARNLVMYATTPDIEFVIYGREVWSWPTLIYKIIEDKIDIIHVNHEPGLFRWLDIGIIGNIKSRGIKVVLTYHTSNETNNHSNFTDVFDRVVLHEKTNDGFVYIPEGIPVVELSPNVAREVTLGTAGFPFPWKGFHAVAKASKLLDMGCVVVAPDSSHFDTQLMKQCVMDAQPNASYITLWLKEEEVIKTLSECYVNVFAYSGHPQGISGAVRMGLAAARPLVLTRCRQFRDLYDYEDEIEFIQFPYEQDIAEGVRKVVKGNKRPSRVLKDFSWINSGRKYVDVYRSVV